MIRGLLVSLRPSQWIKNLVVLLALLFGQRLTHLPSVLDALAAFVIFCAAVGRRLPDQRRRRPRQPIGGIRSNARRPIASGALPVRAALTFAAVLSVGALTAAFALRPLFGVIALSYLGLLALYSGPLKHIVIIDVLTIAIGFVLRARGRCGRDRGGDQRTGSTC